MLTNVTPWLRLWQSRGHSSLELPRTPVGGPQELWKGVLGYHRPPPAAGAVEAPLVEAGLFEVLGRLAHIFGVVSSAEKELERFFEPLGGLISGPLGCILGLI